MKECLMCNEIKDISNFIKDKTRKDGLYVYCKACNCERRKAFREANKEKISESKKKYYYSNKEMLSTRYKARYAINKENEDFLLNKRLKSSQWKKINKSKVNYYTSIRRASKLRASIKNWGDNEFNTFMIKEMYDLANLRTELTGIVWHVDHIIPLIHSKVQGLHVWNNLRVIPATINLQKGNSFVI